MFYENLSKICKQKNTTPTAVVRKLGLSTSKVTAWKRGSIPKQELLTLLAESLNTSIENFFVNEISASSDPFPSEDITYMELIGSVKAGYDGVVSEEYTGEHIPIPTQFFRGGEKNDFFLLKVSGNSMYPKLIDGDIVLVRRTTSVDSGTVAVILYDSDIATVKTIKYVTGENWLELIPANPEYETKHIEGAELEKCHVLGQVVKLIRDL